MRLTLTGQAARQAACRHILAAPDGDVVSIGKPVKRREQEEKYHAMIGDIAKQCKFFGAKLDEEDCKRVMIDAFVRVMRENAKAEGKPDPFPQHGMMIPSLNGEGVVQLGVQSRNFLVDQASLFIEYLFAFGSEQNVKFTKPDRPW